MPAEYVPTINDYARTQVMSYKNADTVGINNIRLVKPRACYETSVPRVCRGRVIVFVACLARCGSGSVSKPLPTGCGEGQFGERISRPRARGQFAVPDGGAAWVRISSHRIAQVASTVLFKQARSNKLAWSAGSPFYLTSAGRLTIGRRFENLPYNSSQAML
jgi:hypothetical protein